MYRVRHRHREMSLLGRGQGMVDGGVEIDCFADNSKAFSLSGKALITPAPSVRVNKPYKPHKLNLPKTFVTRRGQMVLFTAPEDMIIGSSCSFHDKEIVNREAVRELRTTRRLLDSALDYCPEDNFHLKHNQSTEQQQQQQAIEQEDVLTKSGHFMNVYLNSLQKATESASGSLIEDIEESNNIDNEVVVPCNSEVPPAVSECDSGLGHSVISSRLSTHSREDQLLVIPHGEGDENELPVDDAQSDTLTSGDVLAALKNELASQKVTGSHGNKTSNSKTGQKRQRANKLSTANTSAPQKTKSKKSNIEQKLGKSKRKRTTKKELKIETVSEDHKMDEPEITNHIEQVTAINPEPSEATLKVKGQGTQVANGYSQSSEATLKVKGQGTQVANGYSQQSSEATKRLSRAEERRREIERKRNEKRELEAQKKKEIEEKLKLEEELARDSREEVETDALSDNDTISMSSVESEHPPQPNHTPDHTPNSTPNQAILRAELDRSKLREHRWLLLNQAEKVHSELNDEIDEAQEVLRLVRAAEQERKRLEELDKQNKAEEQRRRQAKLEDAARRKALEIMAQSSNGTKPINKKTMDSELSNQRQDRVFSNPSLLMFSYYNYVPPPKKEKKSRGRAAKN